MGDEHRDAFEDMLSEYRSRGEDGLYTGFYAAAWDGYDVYRGMLDRLHAGGWPFAEVVPSETYFVIDGDRIVGEVYLRLGLTLALEEDGGNIGYQIRPSARNNGYATKALQLALARLGALHLQQALLTCEPQNTASIRVIEKCGGHRIEDSIGRRRRYLIPIETGDPQAVAATGLSARNTKAHRQLD